MSVCTSIINNTRRLNFMEIMKTS
uniref:Uncharacterized protein n=1 Tax=Rhizophora mucronata TaxID=61149 RepID=A0A2P2NR67_RHIMU